ncbi:hypothetical protein Acsp04_60660 [Actinomadura sp. NBRC 104425]|uniref:hypothetical protein n=1 Tax=Actinomadura sp. NBRC 104425 TaxID=3032204 RepID=UPI0024A56AC6|nr:hypothetical protein [Actinomadura sp. NBRC 104425]GLZ15831.1 hypothetical protein Acsp04_60660 [Actinomadura sp. NBRC 104425]
MSRTTTWTAASLLTAGLAVGFIPVSSQGSSCGSPYVASSQDDSETGAPTACDDVRSVVRAPALALTIIGGGLLIGALAARGSGVDMTGHRMVLGRPVGRRPPQSEDS